MQSKPSSLLLLRFVVFFRNLNLSLVWLFSFVQIYLQRYNSEREPTDPAAAYLPDSTNLDLVPFRPV